MLDSFKNSAEVLKCLFLIVQAQEKLGPVDMLVNCAGTSISGKFEDVDVDRFKVGQLASLIKSSPWSCLY